METPIEPTSKLNQHTLKTIRSSPPRPWQQFSTNTNTPPDSIPYHVGDLWDGYFFTAMVYWGLTFPTLLLPEKSLYHGKSKFSPENIRLAIAFSMVVAGIIIVEANDPKDIPAGVIGASLFVVTHLSSEKVSQFTKKVSQKAEEALPILAQKIASLPQKLDQLNEKFDEKLGIK